MNSGNIISTIIGEKISAKIAITTEIKTVIFFNTMLGFPLAS